MKNLFLFKTILLILLVLFWIIEINSNTTMAFAGSEQVPPCTMSVGVLDDLFATVNKEVDRKIGSGVWENVKKDCKLSFEGKSYNTPEDVPPCQMSIGILDDYFATVVKKLDRKQGSGIWENVKQDCGLLD